MRVCRGVDSYREKDVSTFIKKYTLLVIILAILALLLQGHLFSASVPVIVGQAIAVILAVSARAAFKKQQFRLTAEPGNGALVGRGPYRFIRHPMYAAAQLFVWVSILGHWSILNAVIGLVVTAFVLLRISAEEKLLRERYPDYAEYALRTKSIIPFIY